MDFRLITDSPYENIHNNWLRDYIPLGKYWSLTERSYSNFDEKYCNELDTADSDLSKNKRIEYCKVVSLYNNNFRKK
jgi:hypothetical protein